MAKLEGRIRYVRDWYGDGEHFLFELRRRGESEWSLDAAFPLVSYVDGDPVTGEGKLINFRALTKVREWMRMGIEFYFHQSNDQVERVTVNDLLGNFFDD